MYHNHLCRHYDTLSDLDQLLKSDHIRTMALDPRFYQGIAGPTPHSPSSLRASPTPLTPMSPYQAGLPQGYGQAPSPIPPNLANVSAFRSSASSPSLRARESTTKLNKRAANASMVSNSTVGNNGGSGGGGNVKVVVRVRQFLPREIERNVPCLISMNPDTQSTTLYAPDAHEMSKREKAQSRGKTHEEKTFIFDKSFWSHDEEDSHYATQEDVYNALGEEFLDHNFEGYHTCIFAYGQTGSGKSYTMMGTPERPGLIPRTCEDLFQRIEDSHSPNITYNVRVSYFEVYNEHVHDLLVPKSDNPYHLKIRESPTDGPYVKDLTEVSVRNFSEVIKYIRKGDNNRTVAGTKMNDTSSRSHAVFTIMLKQIHHDLSTDETTERTARIRLVDLAGSERAKSTEATGQRLREGSNINKSLTTLGRVIAALADGKSHRRKTKEVVPYRDSILTWLLKDSLGGNSKTAMIACISPTDYEETLSTLRYADQAKRIRTRAVVNQDHLSAAERDAQIADMAETIRVLQLSVNSQSAARRDVEKQSEKLEEYQGQVSKLQQLMEETKMISESKIKQLTTENEALRAHLKLAIESLKNPIPTVEDMRSRRNTLSPVDEGYSALHENYKENHMPLDVRSSSSDGEDCLPNDLWDARTETCTIFDEDDVLDMQSQLEDLLSDVTFFKHKVKDDHERFGVEDVFAKPADNRGKRMLSEVYVNV
ncbi:Kinesin [Ascosphaera pollenicola]|nr:Kinesin [Ascosphaera pollenicola]